jgi:Concanavalin A-like lectin/glucanases superfamily
MRSCWPGVLLLVAAAIPAPASAAPPAPPGAVALGPAPGTPGGPAEPAPVASPTRPPVVIARYSFNGRRSGVIADESGHAHTLRTVSAHGGAVRAVVHGSGSALAFPAECTGPACPHVALQSPSRPDLNPGTRDIAFGADVLLPPGQTSKGENIVQKGYSTTSSQWKLQVDGVAGRPSCVLVGTRRRVIRMAYSALSIADGRWHSLACRRAGATLAVLVDGRERGRTAVPATLAVVNRRPLSIGAKGAFPDNDQFNGALDNVWVQIG